MKRFFSHLPAWVERSAAGSSRASASISAMACSAVVIELPKGVFITTTPRAVAAGTSILSTPMPARPITLRLGAASSSVGRDLGGRADGEPVIVADDRRQLVLLEAGPLVGLDAVGAEDRGGLRGHRSAMSTLGMAGRPERLRVACRGRPSRARGRAPRCRRSRRWRRTRCAGPAGRRDSRRCRRRRALGSSSAAISLASAAWPPRPGREAGSAKLRQTLVLRASPDRRREARASASRSTQAGQAAALASARAIRASRPPCSSAQASAQISSSTASIEGVLMVSPWKMPSISLPPLVRRKILGSGQAGL